MKPLNMVLGWAAISGFIAVALGAFGAHGLKPLLTEHELDVYKTAVSYHMWHTLLLAFLSILPQTCLLRWAAWALGCGIVLFSGSLYLLVVSKVSWLGMVTPLGGLAFLLGWGLIALAAFRRSI